MLWDRFLLLQARNMTIKLIKRASISTIRINTAPNKPNCKPEAPKKLKLPVMLSPTDDGELEGLFETSIYQRTNY